MKLLKRYLGDPLAEEGGKYFWFDETWTDPYGPFDSLDEAQAACDKYVNEYLWRQNPNAN